MSEQSGHQHDHEVDHDRGQGHSKKGRGKSSLVRAGPLIALRQQLLPGGLHPFILDVVPGTHPLEELEAAFLRVAVNPRPA